MKALFRMNDFNQTVDQLSGLISEVVAASARIHQMIGEINHDTGELSHRTESQAATLEQTAAARRPPATSESRGAAWLQHNLGGPEGVKFDLIQALDLDADGDLDVMTCEERDQLGVIWYENPQR